MIVMGRVRAPFGIKGWVKVEPFTQRVDGLLQYPNWWIADRSGWKRYQVVENAIHGNELLVRLEGFADRAAAADLKGRDIGVPKSEMPAPEEDEYYWSDLVGLEVENVRGESLGRVERLFHCGANAVLVVSGDRERLLPFVEHVIRRVDLAAGKLQVDWERDY